MVAMITSTAVSHGMVACELRYISAYRLRYEFTGPLLSTIPLQERAGMVVHSSEGIPVGTPVMVLSMLWSELKLPSEPGVHIGAPLLADGHFVTYDGRRVPVRILVDYRVEQRLYVSERVDACEGLRTVAEEGMPLSARMLGRWISPMVIRRTWRYVESIERLTHRPEVYVTVLDALL